MQIQDPALSLVEPTLGILLFSFCIPWILTLPIMFSMEYSLTIQAHLGTLAKMQGNNCAYLPFSSSVIPQVLTIIFSTTFCEEGAGKGKRQKSKIPTLLEVYETKNLRR